jgi:uracil-DNA glycosylase family 4
LWSFFDSCLRHTKRKGKKDSMTRCKPTPCIGCKLYDAGSDFSQPEGTGRLCTAIIGEASGEHEQRDQLPFRSYAPSGSVLTRTINRLGLSRDDFAITNVGRCRPWANALEGTSYEDEALNHCEPNLLAFLRQYKPKVLLAMGNLPSKRLTGMSGPQRGIGHLRGYVLRALPALEEAAGRNRETDPLLVIPTYHPAFLRRGAIHLTGVLARDIARAVNVAAGRDTNFILDLPDLSLRNHDLPHDPLTNPDPWDSGYADWEQRRKQEIREGLAEWLTRNNLRYQLYPTRRDLDRFCREVKARSEGWVAMAPDARAASYLALSMDLETHESASLDEDATDGFTDTVIRLAQFSIEPGQGIALPWEGEYIQAFRWLMKLPIPVCGQNIELFDRRVLKAVGERDFSNRSYFDPVGPVHDTLFMFHRFQPDLPAHLQCAASYAGWKFPWKHLSEQCLELYGVIDTDSALAVYNTVRKTLESRQMWYDGVPGREAAGFVAQVEQVRPILARMEDRGFPVDDERRRGLDVEFTAAEKEARAELDKKFPDEARKIKTYKTVPVEVRRLLEEWRPPQFPAEDAVNDKGKPLGKGARTKLERAAREECYAAVGPEDLARLRQVVFQEAATKNDEGEEEEGERYYYGMRSVGEIEGQPTPPVWCRVYEFSPNSSQQLLTYMTVRRHKIPQDKSGKKTTGKKELERLSAKYKDDFYVKVVECREIRKMRGTYIDGFRPHADGRVHTTFTFATSTNQLSSRNPNVTNAPKHGRLAKPIRAMFRDRGGKLLVEWDKKSYHVMTTGWCARDKQYMRLAAIDMHSFVTWHFLRLPKADELFTLPDDELKERLKWLKSDEKRKHIRDFQVKRATLGVGYGMGVNKLYDMNREYFDSLAQAKALRGVIEALFPKVFKWQAQIKEQAHRQGYLMDQFGAVRWFYEVQVPDGNGGMRAGEQAEEAVAFLPASLAFGDMRELMKEVARRGLDEKWEQVNTVHDSLLYLVAPEKLEEHCREMYPVLTAPSKVLVDPDLAPGGLVVDVEANAGPDWSQMTEISLQEKGQEVEYAVR